MAAESSEVPEVPVPVPIAVAVTTEPVVLPWLLQRCRG